MLAGIYEPVIGRLRVQGSLNALLDPSLGMNMELTGRENILLRGLYNGLPKPMLPRLEEDVAEFAELSDFLDLPVRIYSAGMVVRLGFALATAIKPQILLMDEWFLAGDAVFLEKAKHRLEEMVRGADILVLSSHQAEIIRDWCTRVLWLDQGQVRADGAPAGGAGAISRHVAGDGRAPARYFSARRINPIPRGRIIIRPALHQLTLDRGRASPSGHRKQISRGSTIVTHIITSTPVHDKDLDPRRLHRAAA